MDKNKQINQDSETTALQLPMGQLFYLLYSNGFNVKPDDYIEMLKITERFGSHDIDETAKWICPIIATSETEQARFYNVIEQYKKLAAAEAANDVVKRKLIPRRLITGVVILLVLLLALALYLSSPRMINLLNDPFKERTVEKGVPLSFDAASLLADHEEDTAQIKFAWHFEDSSRLEGVKVTHVFNKPGNFFVTRHFTSRQLRLPKKADSLLVHVCADLPGLVIKIPPGESAVNEPITFTADADAEPGTVSYYQWNIKDSVFTSTEPVARDIVFSTKGDYTIECKAVVDSVNSPCTVTDTKIITVLNNGVHYAARFSTGGVVYNASETSLKWWVTLALLVPAGACLLYSLFKRKRKPATESSAKAPKEAPALGPYDIPFEQNDIKLIQQERDLRRTFIQMRYKAEEETLILSVPGTITSIIRSGGSPQLVYAPLTQQQQYLILIDRANPKSMLTRLFGWLVKTLTEEGIPNNSFYYDNKFTCYNDNFPLGISLQRLADMYSNAILIIIGKAHELVYGAYPVIEEKLLLELHRWQSRAIITPSPVKDWAVKEKILKEYFILLPADTLSLQKLIPALREKIKPGTSLPEMAETERYSIKDTDFRSTDDLFAYLDKDETLFQWLCAICVYPRLRWEVFIEVGKAILDKNGQPEKLNYTNLLKICRITWMQQGVFPQATRLELLKLLTVENELCARERILRMLNYSTSLYGEKGYFFEEEKQRQQLTNQFILHASNNDHYNQYAGSREAFKKLWKNDAILDMPLKKYLDKTGDDGWQTPVNDGKHSVGLSAYFDLHEITINKNLQIKRVMAAAMAVLLIALWSYLGFWGGAAKLDQVISLSQQVENESVPIRIKVIKDFKQCGDTTATSFGRLSGYMDINDQKIPLSYEAGNSFASFTMPGTSLASGKANILLTWDSNQSVITPLVFKDHLLPDSVTIECFDSRSFAKIPLYIRYNDTTGYRKIESTLNNALYRYNVSALQSDFTDSSRIVYYEPDQKPRADSVVQLISQTLGMNVTEEYVSEKRIPAGVPILFLNTSSDTGTVNAPGYNDKADADSYHRMGDQYFTDKQYLKAVQEYTRAINGNASDDLAFYQRGLCYEMLGTPAYTEKAVLDYNEAIRLNNTHVIYYYRRASTKYSLKRYTEAIQDFNKVIDMNAPEAKTQYNYSVYYRGRSYYYLNNLANACKDFKRSGDLGIAAGKKDYGSYCEIGPAPDCNRTFYSVKEALDAGASAVCKLDLTKEKLVSIPRELYSFKNMTELNLGSNNIPPSAIDQLKKALPQCKIQYTGVPMIRTDLGDIALDRNGYTDAAGQQVMQRVSGLLKAQPQGKIELTAYYDSDNEAKTITGYLNTIVAMFEKIGVNPKTQVTRQIIKRPEQPQQQAPASGSFSIHVTGVNLVDNRNKSTY